MFLGNGIMETDPLIPQRGTIYQAKGVAWSGLIKQMKKLISPGLQARDRMQNVKKDFSPEENNLRNNENENRNYRR